MNLYFPKLEANGLTGHTLSFIKALLHTDSIVQVRAGEFPGILSDPIPIERGQRQGCPTSQILFNIFINDIFDGIEGLGCEVPCCVDMLDSGQPLRLPGQLFADDTVGLAPSLDNLHAMLAHFSLWAEDHYMGFGVKECGVMALGRHSDVVALRNQPTDGSSGGGGYRLYPSTYI
jgi:hypothetical protein